MSFLTTIENAFTTTEADIVAIVVKIKTEAEVVESEIKTALSWVAANAPQIVSDLQSVVGIVTTIGIAANPQVAVAIKAANLAVNALNAFATASNAGQTSTAAVLAGYVAVKQAQAAAASAAAAEE